MTATPGEFIAGRYLVEAIIGSGGIGTVYRAIQQPLHRPVALKVLHPALSGNPSVRARFVREARAVAALSHPNIAMVHDFGASDDDTLYMAMELVEGVPLDAAVSAHAPSFAWLRDVFDQVLAGLAHAHARGVIHRDIKPANVIVTTGVDDHLSAKLVDFGIASVQGFEWSDEADNTGSGRVIGTPHFMAPEQARGERHVTTTLDIYTVGLMLYWAVTGRHAYDGETPMDIMMAQVSAPIPEIVPRPGIVPPEGLSELIRDALQKSPRDRIPSASAFRARLRAVGGGTDSWAALPPRTAPRPRRTTRTEEVLKPVASPPTMLEPGPDTLLEPGVAIPDAAPATEPTPDPAGSATVRLGTSLVGRVDERHRLLDAAIGATNEGRGLLITLEGAAGMGKSTLARWLRSRLTEDEGFRAVFGGFHREGERGLRGVREAVAALFDVRDLDDARVAATVVERMTAWNMTEPRDARRLITFLRPALLPDDSSEATDATHALFELILRVLERAGAEQPLLVFLDDLHWAGPETGAFLEYLATEFGDRASRVVVMATVQLGDVEHAALDETLRQLSHHQGTTVLRHALHSLTDDEARTLVSTMLNASPLLTDALVRRAAGNPMHLVQLVRYLTEEALVEPGPDGWRAREGVDVSEVLPPSLADIVLLRIEQVEKHAAAGERVRALLDRCAVLGRSCRFSVLEHMLRIENRADLLEHIDADIDLLLDEELLRMTETRTDDVLSFPTSLIRDVVTERLRNRRTTRRLHLYAAEAKLAVRSDETDKLAPQLVEHFAAARQPRRELEYARLAAEVAARSHRPHDAVRYLERSIALLEELGNDDATIHELGLQVAAISTGFGSYDVADAWYRRALDASDEQPALRARALFGLADLSWITGHFDDAAESFVEGTALAEGVGDAGLVASGLLGQARLAWHRGHAEQARLLADRALERAIDGDAAGAIPEAQWLRADLARARGDVDEAASLFEIAVEGFREQDRPLGLAKCYSKLAVLARMRDDLDRAVEQYRAALEIYQAHGGRRGVAHQLNGLGDVARYRGDLKLASEHYRRAVDIFQSLRLPYDAAIALSNLGLTARESGNLDEAVDALQRALRVSERVGYAYLTLGVKLNLAHVQALRGEDRASEQLLGESLELADDIDIVDPDYASPLEQLGDLMHASGRRREAAKLYARAADMWRELGRLDDFERVDDQLKAR